MKVKKQVCDSFTYFWG